MTSRERFFNACDCLPVDRPPVWIMRQAGRYLPEYRAMRKAHSFLNLVRTPELAAEIQTLPTLSIGKPRFLFEGNFYSEGGGIARGYDLSPDGTKFVMVESVGEVKLNEFQIVLNWFDEVNRLAPNTGTAPPN